jgi:hypothetical protein
VRISRHAELTAQQSSIIIEALTHSCRLTSSLSVSE